MTFTCQEGAAVFQLCLYLSKSGLCNGFSGERQKGRERGGESGRTGGNPSFCYCKRSARENNNPWTKVNDTAFTQWFKAGMGTDNGLFI